MSSFGRFLAVAHSTRPASPTTVEPNTAAAAFGNGEMVLKQIARQAPYLRRYARALTGAQASGDGLVQQMMEAGCSPARCAWCADLSFRASRLYRALLTTWRRRLQDGERPRGELGADQRLQTLDPERRAALLLVAMEGFDAVEAAQVMDLPPEEMDRLLIEAQAELEAELTTDVLIIEDEPIIALDLTRLVRELGHRVAGAAAATRDEAVSMADEVPAGPGARRTSAWPTAPTAWTRPPTSCSATTCR